MALPLIEPEERTVARGALEVGLVGIGVHLPDEVVTNADWAASLDTSDEWITARTGIRERRRAAEGEATSDLAVAAAHVALKDAGIDASDLGAVVVATTTPDHIIPQTAPIVADRLGILAPAFDVGAGCTGFVYGLAVAGGLVSSGVADPILLVGAETLTRVIDRNDRNTAVLFGDGAGAVVLAGGAGEIGPFDLGADGSLVDLLVIRAGGTRQPASHETVEAGAHSLEMQGREVYRHAVTRMAASSQAVLDRAGLTIDDVDLFVGHQANARILDAVARRLGIDDERAFLVVDRYGNTSAASIPIALHDASTEGRLGPGSRVLLTAFGAGLTWGSCLLTWEGERV